jgi:hypothetical protein
MGYDKTVKGKVLGKCEQRGINKAADTRQNSAGLRLPCNRLSVMVIVYSQWAEFLVAQLKSERMAKLGGSFASVFGFPSLSHYVFRTETAECRLSIRYLRADRWDC